MIELIKFEPHHVDNVELTGPDLDLLDERVFATLSKGIALTIFKDGEVVAFAGMTQFGDKGAMWLIPTTKMLYNNIGIIKAIKKEFDETPRLLGVKLLYTNICGGNKVKRWLTWLGFKDSGDGLIYVKEIG